MTADNGIVEEHGTDEEASIDLSSKDTTATLNGGGSTNNTNTNSDVDIDDDEEASLTSRSSAQSRSSASTHHSGSIGSSSTTSKEHKKKNRLQAAASSSKDRRRSGSRRNIHRDSDDDDDNIETLQRKIKLRMAKAHSDRHLDYHQHDHSSPYGLRRDDNYNYNNNSIGMDGHNNQSSSLLKRFSMSSSSWLGSGNNNNNNSSSNNGTSTAAAAAASGDLLLVELTKKVRRLEKEKQDLQEQHQQEVMKHLQRIRNLENGTVVQNLKSQLEDAQERIALFETQQKSWSEQHALQLQKLKEKQATIDQFRIEHPAPGVEPAVYQDLKDEVAAAHGVIQCQVQHIQELEKYASFQNENDAKDLATKLSELQVEKAMSELALKEKLSKNSQEYRKHVDYWKMEANNWKIRFEQVWNDQQQQKKKKNDSTSANVAPGAGSTTPTTETSSSSSTTTETTTSTTKNVTAESLPGMKSVTTEAKGASVSAVPPPPPLSVIASPMATTNTKVFSPILSPQNSSHGTVCSSSNSTSMDMEGQAGFLMAAMTKNKQQQQSSSSSWIASIGNVLRHPEKVVSKQQNAMG